MKTARHNTAPSRLGLLCLLLAACLLALALPARSADLEKITVLTNHAFIGKFAPLFVGLHQGYYEEAGFKVSIQPTSGSGFVVSTIDAGKADWGVADVGTVIQGIDKGAKVEGVFVYAYKSPVVFASLRPYPTLESLRDQRLAATPADSGRVAMSVVLAENGLSDLPFEWVGADPNVYFSLLLSDQVDLISASMDGTVPALRRIAQQRGKEVHVLSMYDWGYRMYGLWLIGNQTRDRDDPARTQRFADATRRAMVYAIQHPEEAVDAMLRSDPVLNRDTLLEQWRATVAAMDLEPDQYTNFGYASSEGLRNTLSVVGQALKLDVARLQPADIFSPGQTRD